MILLEVFLEQLHLRLCESRLGLIPILIFLALNCQGSILMSLNYICVDVGIQKVLAREWPDIEWLLMDILVGELLADEVLAREMLFDEVLLRHLTTIKLLLHVKLLLDPIWRAIELNGCREYGGTIASVDGERSHPAVGLVWLCCLIPDEHVALLPAEIHCSELCES